MQNTIQKPKGFANPFRTLCKNQKTLCENQKTLYHLFLNPRALIFSFRKHPYHCEPLIFLCHLATSSLHSVTSSLSIQHPATRILLQRVALRAPFEHIPKAHLPFSTWHGPKEPFPPSHRVALRGREPHLLGCLVILHLRPRRPYKFHLLRMECPQVLHILLLNADMRQGDHLLHQGRLLHALRVQCGALLPKRSGLQA